MLGLQPAAAQVTDLLANEVGEDVVLTWSTGTPPFRVLRSLTPFFNQDNRLIAEGLFAFATTDVDAAGPTEHHYFYLVLGDGEPLPPGFITNPPPLIPFITSITPDSGAPGDVVVIDGGNIDPTSGSLRVRFENGEHAAEILSLSETQLEVVVPPGTLTGNVFICDGFVCSNVVQFQHIVASGFQDISSIAFEPGTGSLWVADRGSVDRVLELPAGDGAPVQRGTINEPLLAHPSPGNGNGRIYFSNSSTTLPNVGVIRYVDSATNADLVFDQAGISSGMTQDVRCEGLAASDSQTNAVYFLDGRANTIRRIVQNAVAHDLSYGNQPFTFNRPAGARFDSDGNLYVSATTSIFKILPAEAGVVQVATGFTAAAGIDLSELSGIPLLLVADEATGSIWLVNGETGEKEVVGSGFAGPVAVAFSEDLTTNELFYDVAEPTRIIRLPDPLVEFEEKEKDVPVLLSKRAMEDDYPSTNQTEDRKIKIKAKLRDLADLEGTTVYFRAIDPDDDSPYLNGHAGDNLPTSPAGSVTASAVADADGVVEITLEVGPQYVGNNYQVEASILPPPNFKKIGRSKEYTTWRRLYVEHDKMYKQGSFLTQTSGAGQPNPARVFVQNSATFTVGDDVHILSGDSTEHSEGEFGKVAAVEPLPGCGCVDLQAPLNRSYSEPQGLPSPPLPYSFLARVAGGFFDIGPVPEQLAKAFDDGFTQWHVLSKTGFLPYWEFPDGNTEPEKRLFLDLRAPLFFENYTRESAAMPSINYVQLISASKFEQTPPCAGNVIMGIAEGNNTGNTVSDNYVFVFDASIALCAPANVQNLRDHVLAHELGHQLNANQGDPDGHDGELGWRRPTEPMLTCLMNANVPLNTMGVRRFHANPAAPTRDLLCIRTHVDDLNQDSCP